MNKSDSPERCEATHNPGVWPYVSRCTADAGHETKEPAHVDRHGNIWYDENEQ